MPKLTPVDTRSFNSSAPLDTRRQSGAPAAQIGAAISRAGNVLSQHADFLARKEQEDWDVEARKSIADFQRTMTESMVNAQTAAEPGAPDFTPEFMKAFEEASVDVRGMAKSPRQLAFVDKELDKMKTGFFGDALVFEAGSRTKKRIGDVQGIIDTERNTLLDDPGAFENSLERTMGLIDSLQVPGDKKDDLRDMAKSDLAKSAIQGMNPYEQYQVLTDGSFNDYLDPDVKASMINTAKAGIKTLEGGVAQNKSDARNAISDAKDRIEKGFPPPEDEMAQVDALVVKAGDKELTKRWADMKDIGPYTEQLYQATPRILQDHINEDLLPALRDGGATEVEMLRYNAAVRVQKEMASAVEKDPISFAARTMDVGALDLNDPASLRRRAVVAQNVAEKYQIGTRRFFTDEELNYVQQNIDQKSPEEQLKWGRDLREGFGDAMAGDAFNDIAKRDRVFAHAAGLDNEPALLALRGRALLKENPDMAPSPQQSEIEFSAMTGGAFEDMPKSRAAVSQTANAIYAQLLSRDGKKIKGGDNATIGIYTDIYEKAVRLAVGGTEDDDTTGIGVIHGSEFILPQGMNQRGFKDYLETLTDDGLKTQAIQSGGRVLEPLPGDLGTATTTPNGPVDGRGNAVSAKTIRNEGRFHAVGNGVYRITLKDGGDVVDANGDFYYLHVGGE